MKRIENETSRQVTFSKRRNGLLKKAFELSVLCDAEVALIIFSTRGRLYEFSSSTSSINKTVERYQRKIKDVCVNNNGIHENTQILKDGDMSMTKRIEQLDNSRRKLLGDELDPCSIDELRQVENQLERSLEKIRARKYQIERQHYLRDEDLEVVAEKREEEVETELFIGRPEKQKR